MESGERGRGVDLARCLGLVHGGVGGSGEVFGVGPWWCRCVLLHYFLQLCVLECMASDPHQHP